VANPETAPIAPVFGSLFQIGFAVSIFPSIVYYNVSLTTGQFALSIAFAIIVFAPTSGGHFNPAITLCLAFWQGFPWRKVPYYILSQIIGSFLAGLMVYGQYYQQISAFAEGSVAAGAGLVYNGGPASIFCSFPNPNQSLGYLFLIEFFVDSFIVSLSSLGACRLCMLTPSIGSRHLVSS